MSNFKRLLTVAAMRPVQVKLDKYVFNWAINDWAANFNKIIIINCASPFYSKVICLDKNRLKTNLGALLLFVVDGFFFFKINQKINNFKPCLNNLIIVLYLIFYYDYYLEMAILLILKTWTKNTFFVYQLGRLIIIRLYIVLNGIII